MTAMWIMPGELSNPASPSAFEACKAASYVLWAFSGRKYNGLRTVTERYECPCRSSLMPSFRIHPYLDEGAIRNELVRDRLERCDCGPTAHSRLRLRGGPVRQVTSVTRDGEEIAEGTYKIVNGRLLQFNGSVDVCGLEVTYTYGVNPPRAGKLAAKKLAEELSKGWDGDEECMLPDRVTNVSRQGISFTVMDPQDFLDEGRTGIYEIDLFLRAANPDKARKPARVFTPDAPRAYRVTAGPVPTNKSPLDWTYTTGSSASWSMALADNDADILMDGSYEAHGTVSDMLGSTLIELGPERFTIENGRIQVTLADAEVDLLNGSFGLWDLYGIHAIDGTTLVHVLTSTIYPA